MRILHIVWVLNFGGIETMLMNITHEQVIMGNDVAILVIDKGVTDPELIKRKDERVELFYANRSHGVLDIPAYLRMWHIINRYDPDVIHIHSAAIYKYLCPLHGQRSCNVTLHDLCNKANTDHIERIPRVFAISQSVADDLWEKKHVKSIVNPNGIRPELISVRDNADRDDGILRIVQVSRLEHLKKGQHILIQACKKLLDKGYRYFSLDFIGYGDSLEYLQNMVKRYGMEDYVHFLGKKDQQYIYDHLKDYDLFVQPSIYEGFGLTVAEAMAAKLPVLVSSGQGPEEVIAHGDCGLIFKNGDVDDCAAKIEMCLKGNYSKDFIDKAYKRVMEVYNVKVTARKYVDNYIKR